jgi:hypothetical protein
VHAPSQHTESTQKPLTQSVLVAHEEPSDFFPTHVPAVHVLPATQSEGLAQVLAHAPAAQNRYGAQPVAGREPWGEPVTAEHVPVLPATSHALHSPVHALSQQTESTQNGVPHVEASVHGAPRTPGTHAPALQVSPGAQSLLLVQLVLQAVAPHT